MPLSRFLHSQHRASSAGPAITNSRPVIWEERHWRSRLRAFGAPEHRLPRAYLVWRLAFARSGRPGLLDEAPDDRGIPSSRLRCSIRNSASAPKCSKPVPINGSDRINDPVAPEKRIQICNRLLGRLGPFRVEPTEIHVHDCHRHPPAATTSMHNVDFSRLCAVSSSNIDNASINFPVIISAGSDRRIHGSENRQMLVRRSIFTMEFTIGHNRRTAELLVAPAFASWS